jgi:hypothetical protein
MTVVAVRGREIRERDVLVTGNVREKVTRIRRNGGMVELYLDDGCMLMVGLNDPQSVERSPESQEAE